MDEKSEAHVGYVTWCLKGSSWIQAQAVKYPSY